MPHCLMISDELDTCLNQAALLAELTVADAYYRGIPADYKKLLSLAEPQFPLRTWPPGSPRRPARFAVPPGDEAHSGRHVI